MRRTGHSKKKERGGKYNNDEGHESGDERNEIRTRTAWPPMKTCVRDGRPVINHDESAAAVRGGGGALVA